MSPYLVTTRTRPEPKDVRDHNLSFEMQMKLYGKVSRRAVATLEEAAVWASSPKRGIFHAYGARVAREVRALPAGGGKVSLPDGTGIEVEKTTWKALAEQAGIECFLREDVIQASSPSTKATFVTRFNEAQAGGEAMNATARATLLRWVREDAGCYCTEDHRFSISHTWVYRDRHTGLLGPAKRWWLHRGWRPGVPISDHSTLREAKAAAARIVSERER